MPVKKTLYPEVKAMINEWIEKIEAKPFKKKPAKKAARKLKLPYKMLGTGRHRIVYDLKNGYVLKVAVSRRGIQNNETERTIFRHSPPSLKKNLAKVKAAGYGWVIMKRAKTKISRSLKNKRKVRSLRADFAAQGIKIMDIIEGNNQPKWCNLGRIGRRIVVIDYGKSKFLTLQRPKKKHRRIGNFFRRLTSIIPFRNSVP